MSGCLPGRQVWEGCCRQRDGACENARMQTLGSSAWLEHGRCREVRVKGEETMNRESRKKPDYVGLLGKAYGYHL